MEGFLAFGFLVGMGVAWGLGHTVTLFALCSAVIVFGYVLTDRMAATFEFAVGVMLVMLGLNVLRKMRKATIHFHVHDHDDRKAYIHAHSHLDANLAHSDDPHDHRHWSAVPLKALLVRLVHGAAGSAALLALAVAAAHDPWTAILYVLLFGVGSICGMAVLSLAASWPLGLAGRSSTWLHRGLHGAIAATAIALGGNMMVAMGSSVWGAG